LVHVDYQHSFNYRQFPAGSFPIVPVRITRQDNRELAIDTDAYLDSGAQLSLFDGRLLTALEIDVVNQRAVPYSPTFGGSITGYLHDVRLSIPDICDFNLAIGFSEMEIRRNLLGRDFFNLVQIGFREHQLQYYLTTYP
jgi:hypothetical protein